MENYSTINIVTKRQRFHTNTLWLWLSLPLCSCNSEVLYSWLNESKHFLVFTLVMIPSAVMKVDSCLSILSKLIFCCFSITSVRSRVHSQSRCTPYFDGRTCPFLIEIQITNTPIPFHQNSDSIPFTTCSVVNSTIIPCKSTPFAINFKEF